MDYINKVVKERKLLTKILYNEYAVNAGKTMQDIINESAQLGSMDYRNEVEKNCKTVESCIDDMIKFVPEMKREEALTALIDRGMFKLVKSELGCNNFMDLLKKYGEKYIDDVRDLL